MNISITLRKEDAIRVRVLENSYKKEPFIYVTIGDLSLLLPGTGRECIDHARDMAAQLTAAADAAEARMS